MIHQRVEEAFQEIDAAIYSGDGTEMEDFVQRLKYFTERWQSRVELQKKFLVLCEGIQSRSPNVGEDGFASTLANIGIFNTREKADEAIDKIKLCIEEKESVTIILCEILCVENILYENLLE